MRDLGALPADVDVDAVVADLGLDRPPVDPTTLTAEELTSELGGSSPRRSSATARGCRRS